MPQEEAAKESAFDNVNNAFIHNIFQMEISRLRFLLAAYLRTRLFKIEHQAQNLLANEDLMDRLSLPERDFARK